MSNFAVYVKKYYPIFANKQKSVLIFTVFISLLMVGLYGSLKVAQGLLGPDSDISHSLMLWYGVESHGLEWIKEWRFTQDNWIFSLTSLHFLMFWLYEPDINLVLWAGWLIFIGSALVSSLISKNVGAHLSAIIIPLLLVFVGLYGHSGGMAAYSVTHNITNLFGLISVLFLVKWIKKNATIWLLLLSTFQIAGGLSDPWMIPAYSLPIMLVSVVLFVIYYKSANRNKYILFFSVMAVSIFVVKTKFFGVLYFIPKMDYQFGTWDVIDHNAVYLIRDLGGLFNIIPGNKSNGFIAAAISLTIIVGLYSKVALLANRHRQHLLSSPAQLALISCSIISSGGIIFAVLIGSLPATDISGRFLLNVLYLGVVVLSVLIEITWKEASRGVKFVAGITAALFMISGFISNMQFILTPGLSFRDTGVSEIVSFLSKNKLSYGYGPFWGSQANAVTAVTKSKIIIRPAIFDPSTGQMIPQPRVESSASWYRKGDAPVGQSEFFVMVRSDGEECPNFQLCIKGVKSQFGEPIRTLSYKDALIMVWNHPLL